MWRLCKYRQFVHMRIKMFRNISRYQSNKGMRDHMELVTCPLKQCQHGIGCVQRARCFCAKTSTRMADGGPRTRQWRQRCRAVVNVEVVVPLQEEPPLCATPPLFTLPSQSNQTGNTIWRLQASLAQEEPLQQTKTQHSFSSKQCCKQKN